MKFIYFLLPLIILAGCTSSIKSERHTFSLSKKQLTNFKRSSINGNATAAIKVASYFAFAKGDPLEAAFWFRLAAEQGSQMGASHTAFYLSRLDGKESEAIAWYKKAVDLDPRLINERLGDLYLKKGMMAESILSYCLAANAKNSSAAKKLSELYRSKDEYFSAFLWAIFFDSAVDENSVAFSDNKEWKKTISLHLDSGQISFAYKSLNDGISCH